MKFLGTKLLSLLFVWIAYCPILTAQVTISAPTVNVDPATTLTTEIKVKDFEDIGGISFSVEWDTEVLSIQSIQDFALPDIVEMQNYNILASEGKLGFLWFDLTLSGATLADSTTFFSLTFDVIGEAGDSTGLSFSNDPTQQEVLDTSPMQLNADFNSGWVKVNGPNSTINTAPAIVKVQDASPNPFNNSTSILLTLLESTRTELQIWNMQGQLLHREDRYMNTGINEVILEKDLFPKDGVYIIEIKSPSFAVRQKLMLKS